MPIFRMAGAFVILLVAAPEQTIGVLERVGVITPAGTRAAAAGPTPLDGAKPLLDACRRQPDVCAATAKAAAGALIGRGMGAEADRRP